ncbi:MAG: translation initiation factor IF-2 N-terminal domain-containing protein, partial [Actinomycetota bacterium]
MAKPRVHELAKELGLTSKEVLAHLEKIGQAVKSHSSTVEESVAERVRSDLGNGAAPAPAAPKKSAPKKAEPKKAEPKKADKAAPKGKKAEPAATKPAPKKPLTPAGGMVVERSTPRPKPAPKPAPKAEPAPAPKA